MGVLTVSRFASIAASHRKRASSALKVLNGHGRVCTSDVIDAIHFAFRTVIGRNRHHQSVDWVIRSIEPRYTDPLGRPLEAAVRSGIVVVASAGNFGTNPTQASRDTAGITSPGNAPSAITVGAVDTRDRRSPGRPCCDR